MPSLNSGRSNPKMLGVALLAAAAAIGIYYFQEKRTGGKFKPFALFGDLSPDSIAEIEVASPDGVFHIKKEGDRWGMVERNGYPVDEEHVFETINEIALLEAGGRLSNNPESYEQFGLGSGMPEIAQVKLLDAEGTEKAGLYIGKERPGRASTPGGFAPSRGQYVRRENDDYVYQIAEALRIDTIIGSWLERSVIEVDTSELFRIQVDNRGTTDSFVMTREGNRSFEITTPIPRDYEQIGFITGDVVEATRSLTLTDVMTAEDPKYEEVDFATTYTAYKKNGLYYKIRAGWRYEDGWAEISVDYDPMYDLRTSSERTSDSLAAAEMERPEDTIAAMDKRLEGWVFQISGSQFTNLIHTLSDLIQHIEPDLRPQPSPTPIPTPIPMEELPLAIRNAIRLATPRTSPTLPTVTPPPSGAAPPG